jgi:hypothetical protein
MAPPGRVFNYLTPPEKVLRKASLPDTRLLQVRASTEEKARVFPVKTTGTQTPRKTRHYTHDYRLTEYAPSEAGR